MIVATTLSGAVARAHAAMATLEAELNHADGALGDGDTGTMLARALAAMAATDLTNADDDLGAAFGLLARAVVSSTGSSLGTLFATALLSFAKASRGRAGLEWRELGETLSLARDAMLARGGASLGDKTVLDAVDAVARAIAGQDSPEQQAGAARAAAEATLATFRDRPCRIGRARMFAERSIGADDPGMLAFARLLEAVTA